MSEPTVTTRTYTIVFAALLVLVAATVIIGHLPLGQWAPPVAMSIALAKAALIALYFMHVRYEIALVRFFAMLGVFWLAMLLMLLSSDYLTRDWLIRPVEWKNEM